ncbi:hypothetical protein C8R45DRAFT_615971 [Mycena sanguinolenta]|nr:hypothetical protein C8R45DRAFT_615971 [Mycena sanguinolenta]
MLDRFPPEICARIFDLACTDSGGTGRSLSRVSRYIRQTSELARYTTIALVGHGQILAFAQFLVEHPHIQLTTRRLFINGQDGKQELKRMVYAACGGDKEAAQAEYTKMTWLSQLERESVYAHVLRRKEVASGVESILRVLGPNLEVLDISLSKYVAKFLLNSISLPHLVHFTTRCNFPLCANDVPLLEPTHSLRYVHIVDSTRYWVCIENFFENGISYFAPSLTHLRLSQLHGDTAISQLEYALDRSRKPPHDITHLPPTIEFVLLKPAVEMDYPCGCGRCDHCDKMEEYDDLMEHARLLRDKENRVVLLKADSTRHAKDSDLEEWLHKADGGAFQWAASDLDLKVGL